ILAYLDGEPTAWCSAAPKQTYRPALGGGPHDEPDVWSIVCFYVPRRLRGQGIMRHLLSAAVDQARQHGAKAVEAYPVEPDSRSYRFMGFVDSFRKAGFVQTGTAGSRRYVMRLEL